MDPAGNSAMQMGWQFGEKFGKMEKEMEAMRKKLTELREENGKFKEQIAKKEGEFEEKIANQLNEAIEGIRSDMVAINAKICRLEGKNANAKENENRAMLESLKANGQKFKWNRLGHGPHLAISENELVATHSDQGEDWNCARAILPIPKFIRNAKKPYIAFYFEVKIVKNGENKIVVGFCTRQFPIQGKVLGSVDNSVGMASKVQMLVDGDIGHSGRILLEMLGIKPRLSSSRFFNEDDVIGVGLVHLPEEDSPLNFFAACNGEKIGSTELPEKFFELELFPAVTLCGKGDSIRANFGKEEWRFNPIQMLAEE